MEEIFIKACKNKDFPFIKRMIKLYIFGINNISACWLSLNDSYIYYLIEYINRSNCKIDILIDKVDAFRNAYRLGDVVILKCLLENKKLYNINIEFSNQDIFNNACTHGHIEVVEYILNYSEKTNDKINIHFDNDNTFQITCFNSHINIVKYLIYYSEKINSKFYMCRKYLYNNICNIKNDMFKYIRYLEKHNYREHNYNNDTLIINSLIYKKVSYNFMELTEKSDIYVSNNIIKYASINTLYTYIHNTIKYKYSNYSICLLENSW